MSSYSGHQCVQPGPLGAAPTGSTGAAKNEGGGSQAAEAYSQALVCTVQLLQGGSLGLGAWGWALCKMCAALAGAWLSLLSADDRHCFQGWLIACTPALWQETAGTRQADTGWAPGARRQVPARPRRGVAPLLVLCAMLSAGCGLVVCARLLNAALDNPSQGARRAYKTGSHIAYLLEQLQGACHMPVQASDASVSIASQGHGHEKSTPHKDRGPTRAKLTSSMNQKELQDAWMGLQTAHMDTWGVSTGHGPGTPGRQAQAAAMKDTEPSHTLSERAAVPHLGGARRTRHAFLHARATDHAPRNAVESSPSLPSHLRSAADPGRPVYGADHVAGLPSTDESLRQKLCQAQLHGHKLWDAPLTVEELRRFSVPDLASRLWGHSPAVLVAKARLKEVLDAFWGPWDGIQEVCSRAWRHRDGLDILAVLFIAPFILAFGMLVLAVGLAGLHVTTIWLHLFLTPSMITLAIASSLCAMAWAHAYSSAMEALQRPHAVGTSRRPRRGVCGTLLRLVCPRVKHPAGTAGLELDADTESVSGWKAYLVPQGGPPTLTTEPAVHAATSRTDMREGQQTGECSEEEDHRTQHARDRAIILQMLPAPSSSWQSVIVEAVSTRRFNDVCSVCLEPLAASSKPQERNSRQDRTEHLHFPLPVCLCACSHALHSHCADTWNSIRTSGSAAGQPTSALMYADTGTQGLTQAASAYTGITSMAATAGGIGVGLASASGSARLRTGQARHAPQDQQDTQAQAASHAIHVHAGAAGTHSMSLSSSNSARSAGSRAASSSFPSPSYVHTAVWAHPHTPRSPQATGQETGEQAQWTGSTDGSSYDGDSSSESSSNRDDEEDVQEEEGQHSSPPSSSGQLEASSSTIPALHSSDFNDVSAAVGTRSGRRLSSDYSLPDGTLQLIGQPYPAAPSANSQGPLEGMPAEYLAEPSGGRLSAVAQRAGSRASASAARGRRASAFSFSRWCRRTCSLRRVRHTVMPLLYYAFLFISHPLALLLHHISWLLGCLSIAVHACTRAISASVVQPMPTAYVQAGRARGTLTGPPVQQQHTGGQHGYLSPMVTVLQFAWRTLWSVLCPCRSRHRTGEGDPTKCPVCRAEVATVRVSELMLVRSDGSR